MGHILTEHDTDLSGNKQEYEFTQDWWSEYFENAPPVKVGSILKECNDGMWQVFEPDGITMVKARFSKSFIDRKTHLLKIK